MYNDNIGYLRISPFLYRVLWQRVAFELGLRLSPGLHTSESFSALNLEQIRDGFSSLKNGDEFGFDGQDAVTDSSPGLSDIP